MPTYSAPATVFISTNGSTPYPGLAVHEAGADGLPVCAIGTQFGVRHPSWEPGTDWVRPGAGMVTCLLCQNTQQDGRPPVFTPRRPPGPPSERHKTGPANSDERRKWLLGDL